MGRVAASVAFALLCCQCEPQAAPPEPHPQRSKPGTASAVLSSTPAAPKPATPRPRPSPQPSLRHAGKLVYTELVTGGAREDDPLPLIVAVHGLGDRPESFAGLFLGFDSQARIALPRAPQRYGRGYSWFEHRNDGDVQAIARGIDEAAGLVADAISEIAGTRPTRGKPVLTGFSQGGAISFAIAVKYPASISASFPIGGWLPPPLWPDRRAPASQPPIVALHGEADDRVPLGPTKRGVEALTRQGYSVELRTFPGVRHAVPPALRADLFELLKGACSPD